MAGINDIYQGYKNLLTGNETPQAKQRLEICQKCPMLRATKICGVCKCFMPAKAKAPSAKCPINKW